MIDEKILIEKIKDHAQKVGCGNTAVEAGYQLAHEHIIDIIHILQKQNKTVKRLSICKDCFHLKVCKDYALYKDTILSCPDFCKGRLK
jgi:hypothetical protein